MKTNSCARFPPIFFTSPGLSWVGMCWEQYKFLTKLFVLSLQALLHTQLQKL